MIRPTGNDLSISSPLSSGTSIRVSTRDLVAYVVCLALSGALLAAYWIGYRGYADEIFLIRGALGWLEAFPYIGTTHWELRHPYVLSTALSVGLFGTAEWAILIPNLLVFAALISGAFWLTRSCLGVYYAALLSLIIASTPVVIAAATTLMPDLFEALFVIIAFALFIAATRSPHPAAWLIASGAAAGIAFATRETSVALLLFLFGAFVIGYRLSRLNYLWLAAGFLPIWIIEIVYIYSQTGDFLYRYVIDLVQYHPPRNFSLLSPNFDNPSEIQFAREKLAGVHNLSSGGGDSHPPGPLDVGKALNPLVFLFVNHEYGMTWVLGIPALLWSISPLSKSCSSATWVRPLAILLIVWFVVTSYVLGVRPIPRYFLVPVIAASAITVVFLCWLQTKAAPIAPTLAAGLLFVNLLASDLRTPRAHFERTFLSRFSEVNEVVYTRPDAAPLILQLAQLRDQTVLLETEPPGPNDLFLYIPKRYGRDSRVSELYLPTSQWENEETLSQRERLLGKILVLLRLEGILPESIVDKLRFPESTAHLMRVR